MHILMVNDDGPPSQQSSPYVHSLVKTLQEAGHIVSVVLPNQQRSWIGKAHMIGQTVKPTYFRPGTLHKDDGTVHSRPLPTGSKEQEEWILVSGTPASCVQIGLYHYFKERGPIDLVVSGPNYGRNSTAVFSLSSGTLGGALEAAVCKRRAIALSYAFFTRNHDPQIIAGASNLSVRLIEHLYKNWGENVDLYTINVPLVENVETKKVFWTQMLQNYWGPGSCFEEVEDEEPVPEDEEQKIREGEAVSEQNGNGSDAGRHTHKHFKWSPRFTDVYKSVEEAGPGNDGWVVKEGFTSVTPLKANFMHAAAVTEGELKLPPSLTLDKLSLQTQTQTQNPHFYTYIEYEDAYVQPLILSALEARLPPGSFTHISSLDDLPNSSKPYLQIGAYESLPFEHAMTHPQSSLVNAYIIRKALIRKHYLSTTAFNWVTKNPSSILASNIKPSCEFELDYAEFLDDALVEAWELQASFRKNEGKVAAEREWWILKPGMSDRGQGIRLFSTEEELQSIFEEWEADQPDSDDEDDGTDADDATGEGESETKASDDYIVTSHLRHFIAQPYIHPPFLLPGNPRKFHIRTYVLSVGSLKVYVYKRMLALFASEPYGAPWTEPSSDMRALAAHLTNTCLQNGEHAGAVQELSSLATLPEGWRERIVAQICAVTGDVFEAAAKGMMVHFQTLPNAFEVFGLDFLVDERGTAFLLEVNAFPDFKQTGDDLRDVVAGLWRGVVEKAVVPFFGVEASRGAADGDEEMILVKELDLGRR
ncbi:5'/3'-nucleotidase SurE [Phlyctema vagabunda]|uniref:5'/3'-nucleotidase SurE n=1 Tax=Phlyctema vagabunda TaxID=108571 RepID=A0ABR4PXB1_9HELO